MVKAEKIILYCLAIDTGNMPSFSGIERFIDSVFRCCKIAGLSFMWLQKLLYWKKLFKINLRQDHGYKEGKLYQGFGMK